MAIPTRTGITLQEATVSMNGRTIYPTNLTFARTRNKSVQSVIGAEIVTKQGSGNKTWNMDILLTEEDYTVLIDVSSNEETFEIAGRIPVVGGNYKNVLLTGCQLDEDTQNLQGDGNSTMSMSGTYKEVKYS